jgi:DNA-binding IclR family transcriptional regulator
MQRVAEASGFDAVLTVMFVGPRVIDVHRVNAKEALHLTYGRGRPRPLFRSGAPKVLLAHLPRGRLVKIYESTSEEIAANEMAESWAEFRAVLTHIRKTGFYRSIGELEPGVGAMAVPVFNPDGDCVAALALVGSARRFRPVADEELLGHLQEATAAIRRSLSALERRRPAAEAAKATGKA